MANEGSITRWITHLRGGDGAAARELWERFFRRMKQLARNDSPPRVTNGTYDEEDVALSAFANFCHALQAGNYPQLQGRDELWNLLATFTVRKARERARQAQAQKRGGGASTRSLSAADDGEADLDVAAGTPPPDLMVLMGEACQNLLALLGDPELESLALWKLEGYSNEEIADRMGYSCRTINRMLALVRQIWANGAP